MIDFGVFRFSAPPRTGSTWFLNAAANAGLGGEGLKTHVHIPVPPAKHQLNVSLVRHPCDWLASYWQVIKGGSTGMPLVDELSIYARSGNCFDDFIEEYLRHMKGHVTKIMTCYQSDSYIRTCDLNWAAYDLFESVGADTRQSMVATAGGPINQGKNLPTWSPTQWRLVMDAEEELVEAFEFI